MEGQESLLDTLFDEEYFEAGQDVEMLDVEEGEFVEPIQRTKAGESSNVHDIQENQESNRPSSKQKKKKKKNKRRRGGSVGPNVTDVNRSVYFMVFVLVHSEYIYSVIWDVSWLFI